MKLFRRIAALALALVVVAMLGISASAAGSDETINGDFGAFAHFEWSLTRSTARGEASFHDNGGDIELTVHNIWIEYTQVNESTKERVTTTARETVQKNGTIPANTALVKEVPAASPWYFLNATFNYDATYIANGVVDCYLFSGPKALHT